MSDNTITAYFQSLYKKKGDTLSSSNSPANLSKQKRSDTFNNRRDLSDDNQFNILSEEEAPAVSPQAKNFKIRKFPPIFINQELQDPRNFIENIKKTCTSVFFKVIRGQTAITARNEEDFNLVQEKLNDLHVQYYTYTPKEEKNRKLVLKGIQGNVYTAEEIKANLIAQSNSVVDIVQFKSRKDQHLLDIYLVSFAWDTNLSQMKKKIRYCLDYQIYWEEHRKPKAHRMTQCRNCQKWGHHSSTCHSNRHCVKCAKSHQPGSCVLDASAKPKCVNCAGDHPANYRGCVAAINYKRSLQTTIFNPPSAPIERRQWGHKVSSNENFERDSTLQRPQRQQEEVMQAIRVNSGTQTDYSYFDIEANMQRLFKMSVIQFMTHTKEYQIEFSEAKNVNEEMSITFKYMNRIKYTK